MGLVGRRSTPKDPHACKGSGDRIRPADGNRGQPHLEPELNAVKEHIRHRRVRKEGMGLG